jgi:hypothetical protein
MLNGNRSNLFAEDNGHSEQVQSPTSVTSPTFHVQTYCYNFYLYQQYTQAYPAQLTGYQHAHHLPASAEQEATKWGHHSGKRLRCTNQGS